MERRVWKVGFALPTKNRAGEVPVVASGANVLLVRAASCVMALERGQRIFRRLHPESDRHVPVLVQLDCVLDDD